MTEETPGRPLYARLLRLNHLQPGSTACFLFLEGSIALAGVLALADMVSPWALVVLPLAVAVAVKLNDLISGALLRPNAESASPPEESQRKRERRREP